MVGGLRGVERASGFSLSFSECLYEEGQSKEGLGLFFRPEGEIIFLL